MHNDMRARVMSQMYSVKIPGSPRYNPAAFTAALSFILTKQRFWGLFSNHCLHI